MLGTYLQKYAEYVSYQQGYLKTSSFTNMKCYSVVGRVGLNVKEKLKKIVLFGKKDFQ